MKYYYFNTIIPLTNETVKIVLFVNGDSVTQFPDVESNDGPERRTYLKWIAEGNEAEPWDPENPPV